MKLRTLLFGVALTVASAVFAQSMTDESKKTVLDAVARHVKERAYVGGVDFSRWDELVSKHRARFDAAKTQEAFALAVNVAFDEFGFSHLDLLTPRAATTRTTGKSVGIGITAELTETGVRVARVLPGGPAEKAGLKVGDMIFLADDKPVKAIEELRGEKGSIVKLSVRRDGSPDQVFSITRGEFSVVLKDELKWLDDRTVLLKVHSFATGYDFKQIDKFFEEAATASRMIIDLRNNGGGAVTNLAHLAGKAFGPGTPLGKFITRSHADAYREEHPEAKDDPVSVSKEFGLPLQGGGGRNSKGFAGSLVVLTNGASASASEIFAASLKDNGRGKVVGMKTAGAVLASTFLRLPEGFSLQIPMMEYVTAGGIRLEGTGVAPDVVLDVRRVLDDALCIKAALEALDGIERETRSGTRPPR